MSIWKTITEDRLMTKKLPKRGLPPMHPQLLRGKSGRHRFAVSVRGVMAVGRDALGQREFRRLDHR